MNRPCAWSGPELQTDALQKWEQLLMMLKQWLCDLDQWFKNTKRWWWYLLRTWIRAGVIHIVIVPNGLRNLTTSVVIRQWLDHLWGGRWGEGVETKQAVKMMNYRRTWNQLSATQGRLCANVKQWQREVDVLSADMEQRLMEHDQWSDEAAQ